MSKDRPIVLIANTSWYLWKFPAGTIKALRGAGFRVVCLAPPDAYSVRLRGDFDAEFVPLSVEGANRGLLREVGALWDTWRAISALKPLYVFNFTVKANVYGGLACWANRVPFANNVSGLGTAFLHEGWLYRRLRRLYVWINTRADHVFFQNTTDYEQFRSMGLPAARPVTILPGSGVDLVHFRPSVISDGPRKFVMIARLLGDKGVREYVGAARVLRSEYPNVTCVLVGPPGVKNNTAITAEEVGQWEAEGIIDYRGELDDVRDLLRECHVLVLPSYREGMPRTVLEAAACGRPAIVTDVPGCRDAVIPGKTAWMCEARNVKSLADAMRQAAQLDTSTLRTMGKEARGWVEVKFSESRVIGAYMERLDSLEGANVNATSLAQSAGKLD